MGYFLCYDEPMRTMVALIFLASSLYLFYFGYRVGVGHIDCGCGCCGDVGKIPNTPMLYLRGDHLNRMSWPLSYCAVVGCSAPRVPLFVDVYGLAAVLLLVGFLLLGREEKSRLL